MATNGRPPWGQPVEAKELPARNTGRASKYDDLISDFMLRLEQTNSHWLLYPFSTKKQAEVAVQRVRRVFGQRVQTAIRKISEEQAAVLGFDEQPEAVLAVRRGPEWK